MSNANLASLVRTYRQNHARRLSAYLNYFAKLGSLNDTIRFACLGRNGEIHSHQRRVGRVVLERARKKIGESREQVLEVENFAELIDLVGEQTRDVDRFGKLAVYDTSLRLGAFLGIWPELVYLHAGAKKGCRKLGIVGKRTARMDELPKELRSLKPHQAEDFLCIFKNAFDESGVGADCDPSGCHDSSRGRAGC